MTLNKLQENLTKKGYTSEEVDIWTAGYMHALNRTADLKALVAENERIAIQVMHIKPDEAAQAAYEHRVKQAAAKIEEGV